MGYKVNEDGSVTRRGEGNYLICHSCGATDFPVGAKFCPNCGTSLSIQGPNKKLTVSECRIVPDAVCEGEQCKLYWKGENVEYIEVNSIRYRSHDDIIFTPSQTYTCNISFYGGGSCINKQVHIVVEKTSHIVFMKRELSIINTYDADLNCIEIRLNDKWIASTKMRPYFQKDIIVKNGDVLEVIGEKDISGLLSRKQLFRLTITNKILEKKKYYLEFVKEFLSIGEMKFYEASY